MTIQQLHYIIALDTHRHFVKAAESCFVAQPTLTLQVKKLEEEIGVTIFNRSSQPLKPTPIGEMFVVKARQIMREIDGLKELVNQERNAMEGAFKLGIIPTLAPYLLPMFLKEFSDAYPKVHLEIQELQSEQIINGLETNMLDIGILVTPLNESFIRHIPLFYEPFLVYANESHSILTEELIDPSGLPMEGLWLLNQGHCFRNQVLNICGEGAVVQASERFRFDSGSIETVKNMIRGHSGYTLVPELSVSSVHDSKFVRRFYEPEPAREVSLVVHKSFTKEQMLTNLRKSIVENIPSGFKKNTRFITVEWR